MGPVKFWKPGEGERWSRGGGGLACGGAPSWAVCGEGRSESRGAAFGGCWGSHGFWALGAAEKRAVPPPPGPGAGGEVSVTPAGLCPVPGVAGEGTESALSPPGWVVGRVGVLPFGGGGLGKRAGEPQGV